MVRSRFGYPTGMHFLFFLNDDSTIVGNTRINRAITNKMYSIPVKLARKLLQVTSVGCDIMSEATEGNQAIVRYWYFVRKLASSAMHGEIISSRFEVIRLQGLHGMPNEGGLRSNFSPPHTSPPSFYLHFQ